MNDEDICSSASSYIPKSYLQYGTQAKVSLNKKLKHLIKTRRCPEEGYSDVIIEYLLHELSVMDSNNFFYGVGVGEREARIYSGLVSRRSYGLGHGIGRSGDIAEAQPKATGSSVLYQLTNGLALHMIREAGVQQAAACLVVPVATGMSVVLCLMALRHQRPAAKYVVWPRIDQKSCFKAIISAGFIPVVIENILEGDELRTDVHKLRDEIESLGPDSIVAVLTTTSCFAPRGIDKIEEVAKICVNFHIPHLVNNAYGVQSTKCMHHIQQASLQGRVDAFVQSTDKNFMVPVGGSIIAGFNKDFINDIGRVYPGRASGSPIIDLFITLLSMGTLGYKKLVKERKEMKNYLHTKMSEVAEKHQLRVLDTKHNPISIGLSLKSFPNDCVGHLGYMLFIKGVSGSRVVSAVETKTISGTTFKGWGSHYPEYPDPYLTAAAGIGMTKNDVDQFISRLDKCLSKLKRLNEKALVSTAVMQSPGDSDSEDAIDCSTE